MSTKRIIIGIGLLLLAGGIVANRVFSFNISIANIILCAIAAVLVGSGLKQRNFFLILLPLAFIGYRFRSFLNLGGFNLSLFSVMGIAALTAGGLTAIFGSGRKKIKNRNMNSGYVEYGGSFNNGAGGMGGAPGMPGAAGIGGHPGTAVDRAGNIQSDDGENVTIDNSFGKLTRYLHSTNLKYVKIDNGFGNCVVYYDNVIMADGSSKLNVDNGFGQVDLYIPPFYRFRMKQDNGFGSINVYGNPSTDPAAPLIDAKVDNGMGKVNIYFG